MRRSDPPEGWAWFEAAPAPASESDRGLARAFARCFGSPEGQQVLAHLADVTRGRVLGPAAGDQALRHLEGQRYLAAYIAALAERGKHAG